MHYISQHKPAVIEGQLRCKDLLNYLDALEIPKYVWLSEDATSINPKIEFDSKSNQMVGPVLPFESNTGMPISFSHLARTTEEIQINMRKNVSNYVYVVMAQPLVANIPPLLIQMFGTDNKFKSHQVLKRWNHTVEELER